MASAQGSGVVLVTQYMPVVNVQPLHPNTPIAQNDGWLQKFIKRESKALGVLQIMIGIIHICLGCVLSSAIYYTIATVSGVVFWAPLFFIAAGGLAFSAEEKRNTCQVRGALAMNPLSAFGAFVGIFIYAFEAFVSESHYNSCKNTNTRYNDPCYTAEILQNGIMGVLSLLSFLELVISICTSVFECKSVSRNRRSQARQPVFVVQNAVPQGLQLQPMQSAAVIPIAQGISVVGQVMTMAPGAAIVQGMPTAYIGMITPEIPLSTGAASAPIPSAETPPS